MSSIVRALVTIIAASLFLPVSCTVALFVGVPLASKLDERHIEKGDRPHSLFYVVWQPGEAGKAFGHTQLEDLKPVGVPAPGRTFIMEKASGRVDVNPITSISYRVLSGGSEPLIEVEYRDDDKSSWSRYRATPSRVTPVHSRVMRPGYMFGTLPFAMAFAAAVYFLGNWLRRRIDRRGAAARLP